MEILHYYEQEKYEKNKPLRSEAKLKLSQKDFAAAHAIYLTLANQNDAKDLRQKAHPWSRQ
jgi:hypothetical protein